jgi:hypothetical protein
VHLQFCELTRKTNSIAAPCLPGERFECRATLATADEGQFEVEPSADAPGHRVDQQVWSLVVLLERTDKNETDWSRPARKLSRSGSEYLVGQLDARGGDGRTAGRVSLLQGFGRDIRRRARIGAMPLELACRVPPKQDA